MATEEKPLVNKHDFLSVEHEHAGFLINRDQFFASVYLDQCTPYSGGEICPEYFAGTMVFRNEKIIVYEMDKKLGDLFQVPPQPGLKIALISEVSNFNKNTVKRFNELIKSTEPDASTDYIAFRIGSQAEIKKINFDEIKMIPQLLRPRLTKRGILGCRFTNKKGIYFFVDIESISFGGGGK